MEYARKKYIQQLSSMRNNGLVKVVTGARRAGKSYLLNTLFYRYLISQGIPEKNILRFSFDIEEHIDLLDPFAQSDSIRIKDKRMGHLINGKAFRRYVASKTKEKENYILILDEIQYLENFVGVLNGYLKHSNFDVYVTGSNSKFLSSDVVTEFRGRSMRVHVLPLTFSEYVESKESDLQQLWASYITYGGIPLVASMEDIQQKEQYLKDLSTETYLKDIIQRNGIRNTSELSDTFNLISSMISRELNPSKLSNTFNSTGKKKITAETMERFIRYFEESFLIERAIKFDIKGKKYIQSPFKIYFEDIGVRNAQLNFRQIEESYALENIIYNELRYRGYHVDVGVSRQSYDTGRKDKNGHKIYGRKQLEVDFIATKGSQKYYIQSCLHMENDQVVEREKRSLINIQDSFKKIIITKNGLLPNRDEQGIVTLDLFTFLLNENSLTL